MKISIPKMRLPIKDLRICLLVIILTSRFYFTWASLFIPKIRILVSLVILRMVFYCLEIYERIIHYFPFLDLNSLSVVKSKVPKNKNQESRNPLNVIPKVGKVEVWKFLNWKWQILRFQELKWRFHERPRLRSHYSSGSKSRRL